MSKQAPDSVSHRLGVLVFLILVFSLFSYIPAGEAFELPEPDHGVDEEFNRLWSKYQHEEPPQGATATEEVTFSTDYIYADPPEAPDEWNRGEVDEFEGGGEDASIHPKGVGLTDSQNGTVRDAHVTFFAAEPSTRYPDLPAPDGEKNEGSESKNGDGGNLLAPAQDGELHGFVDYRVQGADSHDVTVYIYDNQRTNLTDVVQGRGGTIWEGTLSGGGSFSAPYDDLRSGSLNITAVIEAKRSVRGETLLDRAVVTDTVEVTPYGMDTDRGSPPAIGRLGVYPNGETALFLGFLLQPPGGWSSVTLSDGSTLHSNWRFFSARDTDWDSVVESTSNGTSEAEESYHPLVVHAYPSSSGNYIQGSAEMTATGSEHLPPELPEGVSVDIPNTTYTLPQRIDLRYQTTSGEKGTSIEGIVRGTSSEPQISPRVTEIRETNLRLGLIEERKNSIELGMSLRDGNGQPIDTRGGNDIIRIEGHGNVTTGLDGSATMNISPKPSGVFGEYVPEDWHEVGEGQPAYLSDSAAVMVENDFDLIGEIGSMTQFFVLAVPFLLVVYFMNKILGLDIWPPWRRI